MEHWNKAVAAVKNVSEVIQRTAQSAQELLRDQELRNKGIQTVINGAQTRLQGIQNGIVQRAGKLGERLQDNRRQLQVLLQNLEERLNATQRAWQLQARRRDRVDVQFGRQLIADAPQEVRARLWYVLLENPSLAAPLKCEHPGPVPNRLLDDDDVDDRLAGMDALTRARGSAGGPDAGATGSVTGGNRLAAAAAAALGFGRSSTGSFTSGPSAVSLGGVPARRDRSGSMQGAAAGGGGTPDSSQQGQGTGHGASRAASPAAAAATPQATRLSGPGTFMDFADVGDSDGWELVTGVLGPAEAAGLPGIGGASPGMAPAQPEAVRIIMELLEALGPQPLEESGSDPVLVAQQAVLEAMLQVPWEAGLGLPPAAAPDSRFAVLNEMTAGQEEVDDSILRDIHRTFPEHPYFGMEAGQKALFRVLKAYSLHDLEVAYCQGMAFMAGVLLMYVPEEIAFRLFCRLMDPEGPNLRRLYVPGLDPLKAELATFELLLTWRLPELATHLTEFGLPPVLYVSQWLMTLFATPFPPAFCARVIDVLLQDGHDRLLLRCSYAVIEALEPELLARHDFEALITYLKMEPVSWGLHRQRGIMERALTSPITDAEIEIARDTVSNRQYLAAATAAATDCTAAAAAAAATGPETAAVIQDLLGGSVSLPAGAAVGGLLEKRRSLEHEVEAALAVAAVAAMTGHGSGGAGHEANGEDAESASRRPRMGAGGGGDMISFEDEAGAAGGNGSAGGEATRAGTSSAGGASDGGRRWGPRPPRAGSSGGGAGERRGSGPWVAGTEGEGNAAEGGQMAEGSCGAAPAARSSGACGRGGASAAADGSAAAAYGISSSLLGELDLDGDEGADRSGAAAAPGTSRGKASDLEYGEYGEMLLDAGLLLPELGADGGLAAGPAAVSVGTHGSAADPWDAALPGLGRSPGDDGFGPFVRGALEGLGVGSHAQAGGQGQQRQQRPGGADLLLD